MFREMTDSINSKPIKYHMDTMHHVPLPVQSTASLCFNCNALCKNEYQNGDHLRLALYNCITIKGIIHITEKQSQK